MKASSINISRHALVEAAAGTGKTRLIVKLVARLIALGQAEIKQILIVTFTEKATGELGSRIRAELVEQSKRRKKNDHLKKAITNFESAEIHTIHSFCRRMLSDYSFEAGQSLSTELADDEALTEMLLPNVYASWKAPELAPAIAGSGFPAYDYYMRLSGWERSCKALALSYLPDFHRLGPALQTPDSISLLGRSALELQKHISNFKKKRGLISYQDMLCDLNNAFHLSRALRVNIQNRFRYAIVDEFQDTDEVQWNIFSQLFLNDQNRLFIVGDPRQAIYSFRGADVQAYFNCRDYIQNLSERNQASIYKLDTSYRTRDSLLHSLNQLFAHSEWFGASKLSYTPIHPAPEKYQKFRCETSPLNADPLVAVRLNENIKLSSARHGYHRFIAREISSLLESAPAIKIRQGKRTENRKLEPGDFGILVRSAREVPFIERHLREAGIPHSYYKKPGLFASTEAKEMACLLASASSPENISAAKSLLLTSFFRVEPDRINTYDSLPDNHRIRQLLEKWHALAQARKWPQFFRSALYEARAFEVRTDLAHERHVENLLQIAEELQARASTLKLDAAALLQELVELQKGNSVAEDRGEIHRRETEEKRVQIMTIHASKGLEFPVVFLSGGLGAPALRQQSMLAYHDELDSRRVLSVYTRKDSPENKLAQAEITQEDRRLYYVACTRAGLRLYIPSYSGKSAHGFMGKEGRKALHSLESGMVTWRDVNDVEATVTKTTAAKVLKIQPQKESQQVPELAGRSLKLVSFSGLVHSLKKESDAAQTGEISEAISEKNASEQEMEPERLEDPVDHRSQLFRGIQGGSFMHAVLEKLNFEQYREEIPVPQKILQMLENSGYPASVTINEKEISLADLAHELIGNALRSPLRQLDGKRICDLQDHFLKKELEFIFQLTDKQVADLKELEELAESHSYIKGFIDLVFEHNGRYYLADWKMNFIGEGMSPEGEMELKNYYLQGRIYACALSRYLKARLPSFNFERNFGGIFYLFMRQMSPSSPDRGVVFFRPEEDEIEHLADSL